MPGPIMAEKSAGYGVLLPLAVYVPLILSGIYGLWHERASWGKPVQRMARGGMVRRQPRVGERTNVFVNLGELLS